MGRENLIHYILFCIENISSDMFICYITCFRTFRRKWLPSGGGIDVLHNLFRNFSRAFRDTEILLHRNSKLRGFQSGLEMWMSTERVYARHHARRMNVLDSIPGGDGGKKSWGWFESWRSPSEEPCYFIEHLVTSALLWRWDWLVYCWVLQVAQCK